MHNTSHPPVSMADKARLHRYPLQTDALPSPKTRLSDDELDELDDRHRSASAIEHLPASSSFATDTPTPSARLAHPLVTGAFRPQSSSSRRSIPRRQSSQGNPPGSSSRSRPKHRRHGNSSSTSIDSNALLDHRDQPHSISRNMSHRRHYKRREGDYSSDATSSREDEEQEEDNEETMRLMAAVARGQRQSYAPWTRPRRTSVSEATGLLGSSDRLDMYGSSSRPFTSSGVSPPKAAPRRSSPTRSGKAGHRYSHINHPSSVPSSIGSPPPQRGSRAFSLVGTGADGEMLSMQLAPRAQRRLTAQGMPSRATGDVLIDIEPSSHSPNDLSALPATISQSPPHSLIHSSSSSIRSRERRKTYKAEEDVCFPTEDPSPKAPWPDYTVLEEWAAEESKALDEGSSAVRNGEGGFLSREGHRKVSEPVMVDGRYRRAFTFPSAIAYDEVSPNVPNATFCFGFLG
jgi:magnesium transporter